MQVDIDLTALKIKGFWRENYVLLLPITYPLSLHRNYYKIFGLGSKKDKDFLHERSANKLSNSALGD
jgi:hypothetical protein